MLFFFPYLIIPMWCQWLIVGNVDDVHGNVLSKVIFYILILQYYVYNSDKNYSKIVSMYLGNLIVINFHNLISTYILIGNKFSPVSLGKLRQCMKIVYESETSPFSQYIVTIPSKSIISILYWNIKKIFLPWTPNINTVRLNWTDEQKCPSTLNSHIMFFCLI